ncbi:MAG: xanthine dehydrogenase family protein subunit M [Casimicrobiaceae bacterium]
MKPAPFVLHAPRTVAEVLALLGNVTNAQLLAGGQSLMPMLNMRLVAPDNLIDLNRIDELSYIREEQGEIMMGAMTRQRDIEYSALVAKRLPLMTEAILNVGHRQTRNRGTLGGSLCHLDPSAEMPAIMMAYDATMVTQSARAKRSLPMSQFASGLMTTALDAGEMLTQIRIRPWAMGHGWCFVEFARRHGDFAVVSAAALIELDSDRCVARAALTLGGVGPTPFRLASAEAVLVGASGEAQFREASALAADCEALDDPAFPAWYRQRIATRLLARAIAGAFARAQQRHAIA